MQLLNHCRLSFLCNKITGGVIQIMNELNNFFSKIKRYQDGSFWFGLTCVCALFIPAFAKWVIPHLYHYDLWKVLSEGEMALFSMVITSSLVIDNFLFEKKFSEALGHLSAFHKGLFIHIFPMLTIVFCLLCYLRCQALKECTDWYTIFAEMTLFVCVAFYAAFVKQTSWGELDRHEEESPSSSQVNQSQL